MEDKKTDKKRCSTSMYCYNQQSILSLPSFILFHSPAPSGAIACLSFLSISYNTAPFGGVHDFVSRKTGYVYREIRKTLLRELNHRNCYLPRPLLTSVQNCVNAQTHTWPENPQNIQHFLPTVDFKECMCTHSMLLHK